MSCNKDFLRLFLFFTFILTKILSIFVTLYHNLMT